MGRNSNPSSFQGLSSSAVPGIPRGLVSAATESDEELCIAEAMLKAKLVGVARNAEADARAEKKRAADSFIVV